ncbi:Cloroperoxidase [Daedalea quercina L-15889]|uniref:Cloroperoxidase n=1 Tax=Daedalea quercina L-15889 TaxID=1314783 RepID=A0A165L1V0_9APHY|nr:Cloroperoxidase [Daedalea quercina L-15889]
MSKSKLIRPLVKCALVMAALALTMRLILEIDDMTNEPIEEFSLEKHPYVPPDPSWDSRSPCPALNTLANHGFLPHDGRGATQRDYIRALRQGYNLSLPLATFLTLSGHILLAQYSHLSLADLSRHNFIEHDASLGHWDTLPTLEYAPDLPSRCLLNHTLAHSSDGKTMSMYDFAKARLERESAYSGRALDPVHEEIARGEMSMVLGIFGGQDGRVSIDVLREWWEHERFPEGYKPTHQQTLLETVRGSWKIRQIMNKMERSSHARTAK